MVILILIHIPIRILSFHLFMINILIRVIPLLLILIHIVIHILILILVRLLILIHLLLRNDIRIKIRLLGRIPSRTRVERAVALQERRVLIFALLLHML